uniref:Protein kinase domain-containing protein n=1 Tax=Hanusia phi TaxID=3032 RepID=A0A7S0HR83_9CRYP|mmetsp:Transcript_29166/g.66103  ORF Transcript_29166/g.66103 Transcript_29166/m.66103 type:complete len:713 (+) Transcript_29166:124-2262(+)
MKSNSKTFLFLLLASSLSAIVSPFLTGQGHVKYSQCSSDALNFVQPHHLGFGRERTDSPALCKHSHGGTRGAGAGAGAGQRTVPGNMARLRMVSASGNMGWRREGSRLAYLERKLVKRIQGAMRELDQLRNGVDKDEGVEYCNLPDPGGIARQEAREADRGLCKINRYNPDVLLPVSLEDYLRCGARLAQVLAVVTSLSASLAFKGGAERRREEVKAEAEELRKTLIALGPTFIKVGQVLANRPDIVRADYMEELTKLQDKVPAFSSELAYRIIEEEIGRPISEVFEELSPEPVAAASIGQVYKGKLRGSGDVVAVKVQRPSVSSIIKRDLYLLRLISKVFNEIAVRRLGVDAVTLVDEFAENLLEELDYVQEAQNIQDFERNFRGDPNVKIPSVYKNLSSARVLVMEWIDGVRCTDLDKLDEMGVPVKEFIRVGVEAGMRQLLEFGLFHGDPHPGNVFALADGRIAYVDFGSVAEISQTNKEALLDAVVHAIHQDFDEIARDMQRLGFIAEGTNMRPISSAIQGMWADAVGKNLADFNFRTVTKQFSNLVFKYPIRVPERFALVIRTLLTQEGICLLLDPNFKLLEVAYPYVAKRLLRDPLYCYRLPQVLMKKVPEADKPVFDFGRLFSLLYVATAVAGRGPRALLGLVRTAYDAVALTWRKPSLAMNLAQGMLRWARTKALVVARSGTSAIRDKLTHTWGWLTSLRARSS